MNNIHTSIRRAALRAVLGAMVACLPALLPVHAQQGGTAAQAPLPAADQYSAKGADTCLECHEDESAAYTPGAIFKGKHGMRSDPRTPFGDKGLQCESCHGPGALHARNKRASAINGLKASSKVSLADRNKVCLGCHEGAARTGWHASTHERSEVACTDCHKLHHPRGDPVLAKASEPQVCLACHKAQRAEFHKPSAHPVLKGGAQLQGGLMSCSSCHAPHGSPAQAALNKATLNQTCYACHADKRGPLLWEHQPVSEDCSSCHVPHGSGRAALLTKSPALLCQQCHSSAGHPSVPRTANGLPGGAAGGTAFIVAGSCTNCHAKVHGSNHPSGAKLLR
ncbi:MAG: DmsE family decaheme c-type cytochrome [Rubrivivax sp.]|nr:DmsE family decaheme c-type cytochrome [Rubrivivax sp.]